MLKRNLVIFEDEKVCPQALTYARELALRMDSETTLLMLVEMAFKNRSFLGSKRSAIKELEKRIGDLLAGLSADFLNEGLAVSAALRVGDPAQELLKFLAERPPYQVIIWGSDEVLPEGSPWRRGHWMGKVAGTLECPVYTVGSRAQAADSPESSGD